MENIIITVPQIPQLTVVPPAAGTKNHSELSCLDFASSGHTGFQKELTAEQLSNIEAVPNKADKTYVDEALANIDLSEYAKKAEVEEETTARIAKDTELEGKITTLTSKDTELEGKITALTPVCVEETTPGMVYLTHNTHRIATVYPTSSGDYNDIFIHLTKPISELESCFECSVYIKPHDGTEVIYKNETGLTIPYFGDDCDENGVFTPQANTHYEISFKRVGTDSDNKPIIIARVGAWQ